MTQIMLFHFDGVPGLERMLMAKMLNQNEAALYG